MLNLVRSLALLAIAAFIAPVANAQLVIEITRGQENAVPIAVVPFGWESANAAPFDVAEVVAADLQRSGRFAPLDRKDMIDRPTAGRADPLSGLALPEERFHRRRQAHAEWRGSLHGAVRAVQRAQRSAPDRAVGVGHDLLDACHGAPDRGHHLRATDRSSWRVLDAHRLSSAPRARRRSSSTR
jgi:hypothetical protein